MWPWKSRRKQRPSSQGWPLDMVLARLSPQDMWTLADAVMGMIVFGSTGTGKSSGALQFFVKAILTNLLGGLVLCVKHTDRIDIERFAAACGRSNDLVIFGPGSPHKLNLLDYVLNHGGGTPVSRIENAIQLFRVFLELSEKNRQNGGGSGENPYFERAALQLLRACILILVLAGEKVTLEKIHRFIMSAPRSMDESRDKAWRVHSYCYQTMCQADDLPLSAIDDKDLEIAIAYFFFEFCSMDAKPRSSIISTYTTLTDGLQRGVIRDTFFGETTISPEACRDGKIFVLNFPSLVWGETGRIVQGGFKHVWQRCQEQCNTALKERPVFLLSDEFQTFATSGDAAFQATARSSKVCSIFLTQNLPGLYESMGGEGGRHAVDSLLGNLRLKIFHGQDDPITCNWQSELIGKTKRYLFNSNTQAASNQSFDFFNPRSNHSAGMSEAYEYEVHPWEWSRGFRSGGPANNFQVDAVAFQGGRVWQANQKTYLPLTFDQR